MKSTGYRIHFYRSKAGRCQACDYARAMSVEHQAKAKRWFMALAELGPDIPQDYGKHLRDGVWELRVISQHHQHRFLYSFRKDIVLVTNAFLKKSQAVPDGEIEKSRKSLADWLSRECWEDL